MNGWDIITDLVILLSAASLLAVVAERIGLSAIVGAIIAGMVVGPGVLGWVHNDHLEVQYVAEFGVALLLFTIGLEITRDRLRAFGLPGAGAGVLQVGLTTILAAACAMIMGWPAAGAVAIGAMVALSSTAAVARSLTDSGHLESAHGRMALAMLLVQDLAIVPLVVLLTVIGGTVEVNEVAAELGSAGLRMIGAALIIGLVAVLLLPRLLQSSRLSGNRELPVVLAVVTGVLAAWLSHEMGLSAALGAFIAGLALANSPFARQIRVDVTGLKAIFLTIFFASIGTLADLAWMLEGNRLLIILLLAGLVISGKTLIAGLSVRLIGASSATGLAAGICVAQIGEFSFVLGGVARAEGLLGDDTLNLFLGVSVVTLLLVPAMVSIGGRLSGRTRTVNHRGGEVGQEAGRVVIIGIGPSSLPTIEMVRAAGRPISVIDLNDHAVERMRQSGFDGFVGDARREEILIAAGVVIAPLVVLTLPDPVTTAAVIERVRVLAPEARIIARCSYNRAESLLRRAGVDEVVLEEDAVGQMLGQAVQDGLAQTTPVDHEQRSDAPA